jgi:hypothetical protein
VRRAVDAHCAADGFRVGAELLAPGAIADDQQAIAADGIGCREGAPLRRRHAKDVEERAGDECAIQPYWLCAIGRDVDHVSAMAGNRGEGLLLANEIEEVGRRVRRVFRSGARRLDGDESIRPGIGKRAQQHAVDDAEDRGAAADAQPEGEEDDRREPWIPREAA